MKHLLPLFIFILTSQVSTAQLFSKEKVKNNPNMDKKALSWGYYFGVNNFDFKFDYNENMDDIFTEPQIGFNVGLAGDFRISDFINIRLEPGLVITTRNLTFPLAFFEGIEDVKRNDLFREVKSTYIYLPLLFKFSTKRFNNFKPFVMSGISAALNLSSNQDNPDDNSSGEFRTKKSANFYELGVGIDFYLYWFKFTPSIRGVFALDDELIRDKDLNSPWTSNITSMKTRGVFINFTFR